MSFGGPLLPLCSTDNVSAGSSTSHTPSRLAATAMITACVSLVLLPSSSKWLSLASAQTATQRSPISSAIPLPRHHVQSYLQPTTIAVESTRHTDETYEQSTSSTQWITWSSATLLTLLTGAATYLMKIRKNHRSGHISMAACSGAPNWKGTFSGSSGNTRRSKMELKSEPDARGGQESATMLKPLLEPMTPTGELLCFIMTSYPDLFEESVQSQVQKLCEDKAQHREEMLQITKPNTLYKRIDEVKREEHSRTVEDILYFYVVHRFRQLGFSPITPDQLDGVADFSSNDAGKLFSSVYSREEKEAVKAHVRRQLRPMSPIGKMFSNMTLKILKVQAFEMFASSIVFGYFLRHVYKRFNLARSLGMVPVDHKQNIAKLEALFEKSSSETDHPDVAAPIKTSTKGKQSSGTLAEYLKRMDKQVMKDSTRINSVEASRIVQKYLASLFGDTKTMTDELQELAVEPYPVSSMEEYMTRLHNAIENDEILALEVSLVDLRRMILEATAIGSLLKDAESLIELSADSPLLTPR